MTADRPDTHALDVREAANKVRRGFVGGETTCQCGCCVETRAARTALDALVAEVDQARAETLNIARERQERTAELVRSLYEAAEGIVVEGFAHAAAMCEQEERLREAAEAEVARLRLYLAEIESFPVSGYHAGAAQRMAHAALAAAGTPTGGDEP